MELKLGLQVVLGNWSPAFNQTRMELKQQRFTFNFIIHSTFNQTRMELKRILIFGLF